MMREIIGVSATEDGQILTAGKFMAQILHERADFAQVVRY